MPQVVEQADIVTIRGNVRETPTPRVYARGQQESWRTMARVGAHAWLEDRSDRRSLRAFRTGRHLSYFRCGRAADGLALIPLIWIIVYAYQTRANLNKTDHFT